MLSPFTVVAIAQFQTKQNAIEWERNYMNAQLEQQRHDEATEVARMTCKDKLLHSLHKEQDSLFAKINQFHDRKDAEKQKMLDNCIEKCKWACCVCIYALQVLCRRLFTNSLVANALPLLPIMRPT